MLDNVKILINLVKDDESFVVSSNDIDIVSFGETKEKAIENFISDLIKYSEEFYNDFEFWSAAPNRKSHIPFIIKVVTAETKEEIRGMLVCQNGLN